MVRDECWVQIWHHTSRRPKQPLSVKLIILALISIDSHLDQMDIHCLTYRVTAYRVFDLQHEIPSNIVPDQETHFTEEKALQ